jgi:hypothetical protein
MLAMELEVMAATFGKFGWGRDKADPVERRIIQDWAESLCDYPLDEVQAACREYVKTGVKFMPTYGHILEFIISARSLAFKAFKASLPAQPPDREPLPLVDRIAISKSLGLPIIKRIPKRAGDE